MTVTNFGFLLRCSYYRSSFYLFNAAAAPQTTHASACSWAVPFKVGVHFDADDAIGAPPTAANRDDVENDPASTTGAGLGFSGFYFDYWQNSC